MFYASCLFCKNPCYKNIINLEDLLFPCHESLQGRIQNAVYKRNIAKGTTDSRVEFLSQVHTQILIKFHLQNLNQASSSKSQPNISLSIKLKVKLKLKYLRNNSWVKYLKLSQTFNSTLFLSSSIGDLYISSPRNVFGIFG